MSYIKAIFVITIIELVLANSNINSWNIKTSAINLLLNKVYNEKKIFDETMNGKNIKIKKVILKEKNQIKNETKITIDNKDDITTEEFEDLQTFYYFKDKYYICPKEKNIYVSYYINNYTESKNFRELTVETLNKTNERQLKCFYRNGDNRIFFLFLNSYNNTFIYLKFH